MCRFKNVQRKVDEDLDYVLDANDGFTSLVKFENGAIFILLIFMGME